MAADGRTLNGWTIVSETTRKVERLPDGRIVGCTGNTSDAKAFREWIKGVIDKPKLEAGFAALLLNPTGKIEWFDHTLISVEFDAPQAIGCGANHALTAIDMGASPDQAVAITSKRCAGVGGMITHCRLDN